MPVLPEADLQKIHDEIVAETNAALGKAGITPDYLAQKLKSELNARETKCFFDKDGGKVVYSRSMTAWEVRQRARQDAHKLRGDYPVEQVGGNSQNVFIMHPEPIKKPRGSGT